MARCSRAPTPRRGRCWWRWGALLWLWSRRGRLIPAGLVLWGGATVADSFFRMPMVTTVGPGASAALTEAEKSAVLVNSLCS